MPILMKVNSRGVAGGGQIGAIKYVPCNTPAGPWAPTKVEFKLMLLVPVKAVIVETFGGLLFIIYTFLSSRLLF
jgi:hypothetical protein